MGPQNCQLYKMRKENMECCNRSNEGVEKKKSAFSNIFWVHFKIAAKCKFSFIIINRWISFVIVHYFIKAKWLYCLWFGFLWYFFFFILGNITVIFDRWISICIILLRKYSEWKERELIELVKIGNALVMQLFQLN